MNKSKSLLTGIFFILALCSQATAHADTWDNDVAKLQGTCNQGLSQFHHQLEKMRNNLDAHIKSFPQSDRDDEIGNLIRSQTYEGQFLVLIFQELLPLDDMGPADQSWLDFRKVDHALTHKDLKEARAQLDNLDTDLSSDFPDGVPEVANMMVACYRQLLNKVASSK